MTKIALFSAMKNEGPFVLEWVAYHRAIGFDEIHICENDSTDGTKELLLALHTNNYVTYHENVIPKGMSAQGHAGKIWNEKKILADGDWGIQLDADEFLNVHIGNRDVRSLVQYVQKFDGILIPWRVFGDSGNIRFPGRYISNYFQYTSTRRASVNQEIKTLFKKSERVVGFANEGIHRPLLKPSSETESAKFLNAKGNPIDESDSVTKDWLEGKDSWENNSLNPGELAWHIAQINHYSVRTPEHFALKLSRGRGWRTNRKNNRHRQYFYRKNNLNDRLDTSILFHEKDVDIGIAEMLSNDTIREAYNIVLEKTKYAISENSEWVDTITREAIMVPVVTLPDAEQETVKRAYAKDAVVFEYGSGGSTRIALENGVSRIVSIECAQLWAKNMENYREYYYPNSENAEIVYVNIGRTKKWARPINDERKANYPEYANAPWVQYNDVNPDVVLIDGRFRKACFAATAMNIKQRTKVLFDDYLDRSDYHEVEQIASPSEIVGRMAIFEIEPNLMTDELKKRSEGWFYDPE